MRYHFADQFRMEMDASRKSRETLWAQNREMVLREQMERAMAKSRQLEARLIRKAEEGR
jgi:hypothetical protein